jgi:hypothetical protein
MHCTERLFGERRIAEAVTGSLQTDDEAVTDELVVASRLQRGNVLDARGSARRTDEAEPRSRREVFDGP